MKLFFIRADTGESQQDWKPPPSPGSGTRLRGHILQASGFIPHSYTQSYQPWGEKSDVEVASSGSLLGPPMSQGNSIRKGHLPALPIWHQPPWPWPHICSHSQVQSEAPQAAQPLALTLPSEVLKPGPASLTDHSPFINLCLRLLPSGSPTSRPTAEAAWSRRGEKDRCPWLISLCRQKGTGKRPGGLPGLAPGLTGPQFLTYI